MAEETIIGVYNVAADAEAAVKDLRDGGIADAVIGTPPHDQAAAPPVAPKQGFWARNFSGLFRHDSDAFDRSAQAGSTIVTVTVPAAEAEVAIAVLDAHHPIDLDEVITGRSLVKPDQPVERD